MVILNEEDSIVTSAMESAVEDCLGAVDQIVQKLAPEDFLS